MSRRRTNSSGLDDLTRHRNAFRPAQPPPGVLPAGKKIAMDEAFDPTTIGWANTDFSNMAFNQGYTFLGYPYLSELAQIAEYRLLSEVISTEATRKWIKIKSSKDEDNASKKKGKKKAEGTASKQLNKIKELEQEFDRLDVRKAFETMSMMDGLFGRAHLFIDTGKQTDQELQTPIGDGTAFSENKFKPGFFRKLKTVEPVWTYPMNYNANDPLADDWYRPEVWYVMARPVHVTRLLPFVSKPVPDLLKPAFSFGGLSLSQMAKPYVDNWLQTRQSVNDIIQAFSVMVLATDMSVWLQEGNGDSLGSRADFFNNMRNNRGIMMIDKNTEDFKNISAPLSGLDALQAQAQEHICSVSRIPAVKYTGLSPQGMNASSEGEIRAFYDTIHAYQEDFFRPHLTTIFRLAQINIWGKVDPDLTFDFQPLWELDEKAIVEMQKLKAETHKIYIDGAAVDGEEVRQSLADDENSPYSDLDPADVPEPTLESDNLKDHLDGDDEGEKKPAKSKSKEDA